MKLTPHEGPLADWPLQVSKISCFIKYSQTHTKKQQRYISYCQYQACFVTTLEILSPSSFCKYIRNNLYTKNYIEETLLVNEINDNIDKDII